MKRDMTAILKKRVAALEAENRAIIAAIIQTVGGAVEGAPTSSVNYLQRLRELIDKESRLDKVNDAIVRAIVADAEAHSAPNRDC